MFFTLSVLVLYNNTLTGVVPAALSSKFGAGSFDYNCLVGYTPQSTCALSLRLQFLYTAFSGDSWLNNSNWLVGEDPCANKWFGVICADNANAATNATTNSSIR